jgi:hypothetical protein
VSAVNLLWVELRVAELCWFRRRNEIDIRLLEYFSLLCCFVPNQRKLEA